MRLLYIPLSQVSQMVDLMDEKWSQPITFNSVSSLVEPSSSATSEVIVLCDEEDAAQYSIEPGVPDSWKLQISEASTAQGIQNRFQQI